MWSAAQRGPVNSEIDGLTDDKTQCHLYCCASSTHTCNMLRFLAAISAFARLNSLEVLVLD